MAYRKIHSSFWTDPDIEELTPEQKYFYLWLITNPAVNQIGLYEFSVRRASFETGYNKDTIEKLLSHFEKSGKIKISKSTNEILVCKFYFHNKSSSPKVQSHVQQLLNGVKNKVLIQYIYSMGTASQKEEVQVQTKGKNIYPSDFEIAWEMYQRKGSKKLAYVEWKKLPDEEKEKAKNHIPNYIQSNEPKYLKDFERYLKHGTFESAIITKQHTNGTQQQFNPELHKENYLKAISSSKSNRIESDKS